MTEKEYFTNLFNYLGFIPNYWKFNNKNYNRDDIAKCIGVKYKNILTGREFECFEDCWEDMIANFPCDTHTQMGWEYVSTDLNSVNNMGIMPQVVDGSAI